MLKSKNSCWSRIICQYIYTAYKKLPVHFFVPRTPSKLIIQWLLSLACVTLDHVVPRTPCKLILQWLLSHACVALYCCAMNCETAFYLWPSDLLLEYSSLLYISNSLWFTRCSRLLFEIEFVYWSLHADGCLFTLLTFALTEKMQLQIIYKLKFDCLNKILIVWIKFCVSSVCFFSFPVTIRTNATFSSLTSSSFNVFSPNIVTSM